MKKSELISLIRMVVREEINRSKQQSKQQIPSKQPRINPASFYEGLQTDNEEIIEEQSRNVIPLTGKNSKEILANYAKIKEMESTGQLTEISDRGNEIDKLIKKKFGV
jgi:hypothetical protein